MTKEREEAIKLLTQYIDYDAETPDYYEMEKACKVALKVLKQEPCEGCDYKEWLKGEAEPKTDVLDKIRTEIEKLRPHLRPEQMTDYDYAMVDVVNDIVAIFDKYKTESEGVNANSN